ncbi:MAG: hypothetical protein A3B10_01705 [Candidatus Doudnabacteria bacterium RIFCSPLOWO2_01_FULL_44_21]|uniref:DUF3467 domain-containing protein n=1 Tax=Candidatus Doudnabacteria bacterium RIFCSPLOWO2_01_FULL_44_21 TaxID=1817841 RepID=A0A1F5Q2I6_9BACT|nr:MAG: hypothetical protein A3B95_01585 [Candidatus Doudnabacteria bacterium RIFCSPHIGHO2_02_FULL_43_13b]OGE96383.1 MAG: hypothetical protein A3B10_01705 [Candidatus Doudnabacteria bacterium RIFCSPLOWO2_01_FULL_44_21]
MNQPQQQNINIKIPDEVLKGSYANMMMVSHTQEEFILDFMNILPPSGMVTARIITSPGHLKRIIAALADNLKKYESQFGTVKEASAPTTSEIGFKTQA